MRIADMEIADDALSSLCATWKIRRVAVFGSAETGQLRPDSDVDLLVDFEPDEQWSLMDLARAEIEFQELLGRKVDLVDRKNLERSTNWIRRDAILSSARMLYVS